MWPLASLPLFGLYGLLHHCLMHAVAPSYRAFDTFTKHSWIGRGTSITTQVIVLPLMAYFGQSAVYHHVLAMYMIADMAHMSMYLQNDIPVWIHHALCLVGYGVTFFISQEMLDVMVTGSLVLELTSPLIHLSWFANKLGYSQSPWFPYLAGLTLVNFFVVRCIWFPYFLWYSVATSLWIFGFMFMVLNVYWMYKLVGHGLAVLTKAVEKEE